MELRGWGRPVVVVLLMAAGAVGFTATGSAAAESPHPRPDFERASWQSLNGPWAFAFDPDDVGMSESWFALGDGRAAAREAASARDGATSGAAKPASERDGRPAEERHGDPFGQTIEVPFPWESTLSGIARPDYDGVAWYRRTFTLSDTWQGQRIWLCFGAVDWSAKVWINGAPVGEHEGGYDEFRLDIGEAVRFDQPNTVVLRAEDYTDPETPIGKQVPNWYTSTSGIWQSVWLETTGKSYVTDVRIVPEADEKHTPTGTVRFEVEVAGAAPGEGQPEAVGGPGASGASHDLVVEVRSPDGAFPTVIEPVMKATTEAGSDSTTPSVTLAVGIPRAKLWHPDHPHLYNAEVILRAAALPDQKRTMDSHGAARAADAAAEAAPLDRVATYFGVRTVAIGSWQSSEYTHVLLNGRPIYLRGALDQSFNPEGIYTAPDDAYLRRDIELAKAAGFNMLRVHIKADEPRRLYWADRLGMLIQADVPCIFKATERGRQTFEATLRAQIARDKNHPSILAWTVFNEEWGIGRVQSMPRAHRVEWVEQMVALTRALDPTRLVQDNSGWSHLTGDLNSFHWYGRDVNRFAADYRAINDEKISPTSTWNYIDDRTQGSVPFINNEFGQVSAGAGDSDVSWGTLMLVNAMRACDKLVGYCYTELSDIEWEHNGIYNYDRSPKEFGYDAWAEGMTIRDVFAPDFLVFDLPPIKQAEAGEKVRVPMLVSAYSGHAPEHATLLWEFAWWDTLGKRHLEQTLSKPIRFGRPYQLRSLGAIPVDMPGEPALACLRAWIQNPRGGMEPVHRNFTHWLVGTPEQAPPVDTLGARIALRVKPTDISATSYPLTDLLGADANAFGGSGAGWIEYTISVPERIAIADIRALGLIFEAAGWPTDNKLDWPARPHPDDFPQTDEAKSPTTLHVYIDGERQPVWRDDDEIASGAMPGSVAELRLPDAPCDARGVLSHWRGALRGGYGYRVLAGSFVGVAAPQWRPGDAAGDDPAEANLSPHERAAAAARRLLEDRLLTVRIEVPEGATNTSGLRVFGAGSGRYPLTPTVVLSLEPTTSEELPADWHDEQSVARHTLRERVQTVLPDARTAGHTWRYTTDTPSGAWTATDYDDAAWSSGPAGFGREGTPGAHCATPWLNSDIWLRTSFEVSGSPAAAWLVLHHDEDCEVHLNGQPLLSRRGYTRDYVTIPLSEAQCAMIAAGKNTLAIHCHQTGGGQYIDAGVVVLPH
jgi:hypothetical protein